MADAGAAAGRVGEAQEKVNNQLSGLRATAAAAERAVSEARAMAPEFLVDAVLRGEVIAGGASVAQCEARWRASESAVQVARDARRMLSDEAVKADIQIGEAKKDLDDAVTAVVRSDPARQAVVVEFNRCARRALACARALRSAGLSVQGATGAA